MASIALSPLLSTGAIAIAVEVASDDALPGARYLTRSIVTMRNDSDSSPKCSISARAHDVSARSSRRSGLRAGDDGTACDEPGGVRSLKAETSSSSFELVVSSSILVAEVRKRILLAHFEVRAHA